MKPFKLFETERLILKPTLKEDAAFILELLNTPGWKAFIGDRHVNTIEDARNYIKERMLTQLFSLGYGNYTVIRRQDNVKTGTCGLYKRTGLQGVDIGFAFLPQYMGTGYAFEAATKIMQEARDSFGLEKLQAITTEDNTSSQKLLGKLGLTFRQNIHLPNIQNEMMLYSTDL
ncbi:MAG: GNAT family N-acetyltransferase [Cyclobacteriaceae bacterium]